MRATEPLSECADTPEPALARGRDVLHTAAEALMTLGNGLDEGFGRAARLLVESRGHIVCSGIGKSGLIARKAAATLSSVGLPALYLHPVEARHGDLGTVQRGQIAMVLSASGRTPELLPLCQELQQRGLPMLVLTGQLDSPLARMATVALPLAVDQGSWPLGILPCVSGISALALTDALAVATVHLRGFGQADFGRLHPAGRLGFQTQQRVGDLMHSGTQLPWVAVGTPLAATILEMTSKRLGMTTVVDAQGRLAGVLSDGDLRRALSNGGHVIAEPVEKFMSTSPKLVAFETPAGDATVVMEQRRITFLVVVDEHGRPEGVVHLHDLLGGVIS